MSRRSQTLAVSATPVAVLPWMFSLKQCITAKLPNLKSLSDTLSKSTLQDAVLYQYEHLLSAVCLEKSCDKCPNVSTYLHNLISLDVALGVDLLRERWQYKTMHTVSCLEKKTALQEFILYMGIDLLILFNYVSNAENSGSCLLSSYCTYFGSEFLREFIFCSYFTYCGSNLLFLFKYISFSGLDLFSLCVCFIFRISGSGSNRTMIDCLYCFQSLVTILYIFYLTVWWCSVISYICNNIIMVCMLNLDTLVICSLRRL